ncbi:MAG: Zn-finger protein [Asgard archaea virus VerdaV3]|nr:MAG: Zn-finger protein [Asgard archaea virus VerdaV3]
MAEKNRQRVLLKCKECGETFWTEFDLNTSVLKVEHLVCDDCFVEEGE